MTAAIPSHVRSNRWLSALLRLFAGAVVLLMALVGVQTQTTKAFAATKNPSKTVDQLKPGSEAQISLSNSDAKPIQVVIDGVVHTPRLPSGAKIDLVVEPRRYVVEVRPVGSLPTSSSQSVIAIEVLPSETISLDATSTAIGLRERAVLRRLPGRVVSMKSNGLRVPRSVSLMSVLAAIVSMGAATAFVLAQLTIERARVRDDRASARMQQMASQTLSSLPALSMDFAARTRRP
jgi:hypothetical protein